MSIRLLPVAFALLAQSSPPLAVVNATLHQYEDGPKVYAGHKYIAGETVFLTFQVQGYKISEDDRIHLRYRIDALDSEGVRLAETKSGEVKTQLAPEDKEWLPKVGYTVVVPPHALPGEYRIVATVKDELKGQEARIDVPFPVQGRRVEASDTLVVRNFRFLRSEDATQPLSRAAYRAGDTLWARFDITGFQLGEKNRLRVAYGIAILAGDKMLYEQPEAALEEDAPFYPRRHVPGLVSLNVQPKTTPGEYVMRVMVRDEIGDQTYETDHTFRVE